MQSTLRLDLALLSTYILYLKQTKKYDISELSWLMYELFAESNNHNNLIIPKIIPFFMVTRLWSKFFQWECYLVIAIWK